MWSPCWCTQWDWPWDLCDFVKNLINAPRSAGTLSSQALLVLFPAFRYNGDGLFSATAENPVRFLRGPAIFFCFILNSSFLIFIWVFL